MALAVNLMLVDPEGRRFSSRIEQALLGVSGRLKRQFQHVREDSVLVEVLEEAGWRIVRHERQRGELAQLHGYAWVAARSVAVSFARRRSHRMASLIIGGRLGEISLAAAADRSSPADQVERTVLRHELLSRLDEQEREVFEMKDAGFSSGEIADHQGRSIGAVNTSYCRAKMRLRDLLAGKPARLLRVEHTQRASVPGSIYPLASDPD